MAIIEEPATITKDQVSALAHLRGRTNDYGVEVHGQQATRGTLRYVGFVGAINLTTKLYDGVHRFAVLPVADLECGAFTGDDLWPSTTILRSDSPLTDERS